MTTAQASGTFSIAGDLPVVRLGYGAMQLTGPGIWGEPRDPDEAIRVLRRAVELGITFIDTADSYGPEVSERLIREALHPYADDVVVATKAGLTRQGPDVWTQLGQPAYLRQLSEVSVEEIEAARKIAPITTVQNLYNLADRRSEAVLDHCEAEGIGFIPWFPLATGELSKADGPLAAAAAELELTDTEYDALSSLAG